MKILNIILFTMGVIALFSCEKEVEYKIEFEGEKLVVYGFINLQDTVKVHVSKTLPVFKDRTGDLFISNAEVLLFEDNQLLEQLTHSGQGNYISPSGLKPVRDKAYHIEVSAQGLPSVKSSAETIPSSLLINELEFVDSIRSSSQSSGETLTFLFNLVFDDPILENNYYSISILGQSIFGYLDDVFSFTVDDVYDQGAGAQCDFFFNSELEYRIGFSDYCFEGQGQKIPLVVDVYSSQSSQSYTAIKVNFFTLSESLFLFNKSLSSYRDNEIEPLEPTFIESNIEGGYGVFGSYFQDDKWFEY